MNPLEPERLIGTLVAHEVEFIVIGAFAVAAHGFVRGTKDIDICPNPDAGNRRRLAAALEAMDAQPLGADEFREFEPRPDAEGLAAGGNRALRTRYGRLDIMQWPTGLERGYAELSAEATERGFVGHGVRFCGYDDLVRMKEAAGRDQDRIDVANLRAARGEL